MSLWLIKDMGDVMMEVYIKLNSVGYVFVVAFVLMAHCRPTRATCASNDCSHSDMVQ